MSPWAINTNRAFRRVAISWQGLHAVRPVIANSISLPVMMPLVISTIIIAVAILAQVQFSIGVARGAPACPKHTCNLLAHGRALGPRLRVAGGARVHGSLGLRAVRLGSQAFHLECRRLRQYKEITAATRGSIICALPQSAVVYLDSVPLLSAVRGTDRPTG